MSVQLFGVPTDRRQTTARTSQAACAGEGEFHAGADLSSAARVKTVDLSGAGKAFECWFGRKTPVGLVNPLTATCTTWFPAPTDGGTVTTIE